MRTEDLMAGLKPGTCLWRDFSVNKNHEVKLANVPFTQTDKGNFTARLLFYGSWLFEPTVWNRAAKPHGFVIFVDELPPDDWTHLTVQRVAGNRKSLTAKYGGLLPSLEEYLVFCQQSFKLKQEIVNETPKRKIQAGLSLKVSLPKEQHRMVVVHHFDESDLVPTFQYVER